ncbi:hypothetical protein [Streptomyces sp. NPDC088350]|uniref:hypothetical protein n=1 Tax=Streptomyces sp. NPDC088350 TaxID=3365854 RepID=UPI00380C882B
MKGIRAWLVLFVVCLVLSGATAFPLVHELRWTEDVLRSLDTADTDYPFLLHGTDRPAFAHLVIAVAFYGPCRDPVRNIWVVEFGMIRGIPFWWTVIDMSFGVIGIVPLYVVRKKIKRLEAALALASTPVPSPPSTPRPAEA